MIMTQIPWGNKDLNSTMEAGKQCVTINDYDSKTLEEKIFRTAPWKLGNDVLRLTIMTQRLWGGKDLKQHQIKKSVSFFFPFFSTTGHTCIESASSLPYAEQFRNWCHI